ncbi:unnamed protein product [marine sediment metagenome]|uniref:Uncharacterized protein n=1 Tax=marine sediment metagenome TaxID=412755 RepID=X1AQW8_9ZZZZ
MLKRIQLVNGNTLYINTDLVTLVESHPTNAHRVKITLACGTVLDVVGNQVGWVERLAPFEPLNPREF